MPSTTDSESRPDIHCMGCGYSLRGLPVDGDCPECGIAIATSIGSAFTLRRRELVVLACRLLAIWMIVMIAALAAQLVSEVAMVMAMSGPATGYKYWLFARVGMFAIYVAAAAALWWGAGWFARRIFGRDGVLGFDTGSTRRDDLSAVVFAAVGVYLFVSAIGPIVVTIFTVYPLNSVSFSTADPSTSLIDPIIRAVAGLLLLLRAGTVVRLLTWLRTAGTHKG